MIAEALILGLSTGTYCLMTCAPLALPLFVAEGGEFRGNAIRVLLFMGGRLLAYVAVGFALGSLGAYAAGFAPPATQHALLRLSNAGVGLVLLWAAIAKSSFKAGACAAAKALYNPSASAFAGGVATGLSLCPPFFAAAAKVFGGGGGLEGAAFFSLFFLGTSVWFLPLLGASFVSRRLPALKTVATTSMFLLGAYYLLVGAIFGVA